LKLKETLTQENITLEDKRRKLKEAEAANITLTKQTDELKNELNLTSSVKNHLNTQIASKEEVLHSNDKTKQQLRTAIQDLNETVESRKWAAKWLCEQPEDVSTWSG
jgi:chromosome segregation ATPase